MVTLKVTFRFKKRKVIFTLISVIASVVLIAVKFIVT